MKNLRTPPMCTSQDTWRHNICSNLDKKGKINYFELKKIKNNFYINIKINY